MDRVTHTITDPDGEHAGTITIERRTYGTATAVSVALSTEYGSASVTTTEAGLVALGNAIIAAISPEDT